MIREVGFDDPAVRALLAEWSEELGHWPKGGGTVEAADFDAVFVYVAEGVAIGCVGLKPLTPGVGEVKRVFVSRTARGRGVGLALFEAVEQRARERGYDALYLDTGGDDALPLFRAAGFEPIADYNGNPHARHWFGKQLTRRGAHGPPA